MNAKLYYLHDPMCSWCWGYSPTWQILQQHLPKSLIVEYVAGGLAPDSNVPMPIEQQQMLQNYWRTIEQKLGTRFNHDFWLNNTPRRSTYNACRAAIAADYQGCQQSMIKAIQQAYYLQALNPSDLDVLIALAQQLSEQTSVNFNVEQFITDISSAETEKELFRQIHLARGLSQQGFPSLVLEADGAYYQIKLDYLNYQTSLIDINDRLG
ncbi:DsbA family protein [Colwellia sp. E2M01]|uniref:DsbA family protein n=1 Tax=Colwellia sp. E2M01 TaxID=2841561 RepID=UPI001C09A5F1|nr:DsbA family protein [Colwellia sp. E2M01]MBU2870009.1 DsbA family protein [Colwellia sp. E2M01]